MIFNKTIKTENSKLEFYYEDVITYIKLSKLNLSILNSKKNSKKIYAQILTKSI